MARTFSARFLGRALGAVCALAAAAALPATAADAGKRKVYLSMSYVGNDWQAQAQNMISAMAK